MYRVRHENRLERERATELEREVLARRLRAVRPRLDNQAPFVPAHLASNKRRAQRRQERDRLREIQRQNEVIVRHITTHVSNLDNRHVQQKAKPNAAALKARREARIQAENERLRRSIRNVKPVLDVKSMESDFQHKLQLLQTLGDFPYRKRERKKKTTTTTTMKKMKKKKARTPRRPPSEMVTLMSRKKMVVPPGDVQVDALVQQDKHTRAVRVQCTNCASGVEHILHVPWKRARQYAGERGDLVGGLLASLMFEQTGQGADNGRELRLFHAVGAAGDAQPEPTSSRGGSSSSSRRAVGFAADDETLLSLSPAENDYIARLRMLNPVFVEGHSSLDNVRKLSSSHQPRVVLDVTVQPLKTQNHHDTSILVSAGNQKCLLTECDAAPQSACFLITQPTLVEVSIIMDGSLAGRAKLSTASLRTGAAAKVIAAPVEDVAARADLKPPKELKVAMQVREKEEEEEEKDGLDGGGDGAE